MSEKTREKMWEYIALGLISMLVRLPIALYTAFVAQCFWNWFAVPAFGLSYISFFEMFGLWWLIDQVLRPASAGDSGHWSLLASLITLCVPAEKQEELTGLRESHHAFRALFVGFDETVQGIARNTFALVLGIGLHFFIS